MAELLTTPRELFAARLRQMLWIELKLSDEILPQLLEQAHATDLKYGLERHLLETREHVETVRQVLQELQVPSEPEASPALAGLQKEHEQLLKQVAGEGHLLEDLAHTQAAATTEHVEIASYHSLATMADALGEEEIGIRLRVLKEQEELALELLERSEAKLLAEKVESERL